MIFGKIWGLILVLIPKASSRFKKDLKKYQHKPATQAELNVVLKLLVAQKKLPEKYSDHQLSGDYGRYRECHIKPDVLLVYRCDEEFLYLSRIGSHSELF